MELSEHRCFLYETKIAPQHKYKLSMSLEDC